VLSESRQRLYALTRFDDGISVIDTGARSEISHVQMYNPEPDFIVAGRPFLYDARFSSSKGDSSCGSCHLFGDNDGLAWNLGNPDAAWSPNPLPYVSVQSANVAIRAFHPLKGPMVTQSLRGLEFQGPMHWRGDRTGTPRVNGESKEKAAFKQFNAAFVSLLGNTAEPSDAQMDAFADFALQLRYPPNPIAPLDGSMTPAQANGFAVFASTLTTGVLGRNGRPDQLVTCASCHELDPDGQRFGSKPLMSFEGVQNSQNAKIPQLRNLYQKAGMFGSSGPQGVSLPTGPQIAGFGFRSDGMADTLRTFLSDPIFHVPAESMDDLITFMFAMPTGLAPMVGQQFTLTAQTADGQRRIDAMIERALAHTRAGGPATEQCELIAKGVVAGRARGWLLLDSGSFESDDPSEGPVSDAALRDLAVQSGNAVTYTCVPPGAGMRMAIDRDEDGVLDAADATLAGKAATSIAPVDPNAPTETDELTDAVTWGFTLEAGEVQNGSWPNFRVF
jgi:hypothetical protein